MAFSHRAVVVTQWLWSLDALPDMLLTCVLRTSRQQRSGSCQWHKILMPAAAGSLATGSNFSLTHTPAGHVSNKTNSTAYFSMYYYIKCVLL